MIKLITISEIKDFLKERCNTIIISSTIKSAIEKLDFRCECGELFSTSWHKIKTQNKIKCNSCSKKETLEKKRIEQQNRIIEILLKDGNKLLSEYKNNSSKIKILCSCGREFETTWASYTNVVHRKNKCNTCSQPLKVYEENLLYILDSKRINYEREKTFDGLKHKRNLKFDFFLNDYNTAIEIDEKYHNSSRGKKEYYEKDIIKQDYCDNNKIRLVRITDKNTLKEIVRIIDDIVSTQLKD